ncbi:hypothetical protein U9M48_027845 [Paspalum notatum var. saurae]|uniref:Integrase catalytic domain-containing protein n=1 Tax=Paspalum notatum var. saurae TaxID=547442 RepID=A0AAQ3TTR6_PASNO
MTDNHRWFSSLTPVSSNEHIIFGDKGTERDVALVGNLGYNLLSVSQLLEEGYVVRFKKGCSRVLDARESLVMTAHPGELLHMDTVRPSWVRSVGGKWYVLVIMDDFSRWSWVHFMESKDEAFEFVHDLVLRLRTESGHSMRALRSDNGSEFKNDHFKTFCHSQGLEHQFSSPYVPQQNGVVERKNRTLVEMARTMLDEHRTPRKFWAEAINTACYVSNRIFLRAVLNKTSYELRFGQQPKVRHPRVFGCRCFVLK